jgi:hypothetical protein
MMQAHSFFWHYLWLGPAGFLAIVAITMFRRGLHRVYPMFFLYAIWQVVLTPLLFVLDHLSFVTIPQYEACNWIDALGSIVLRFAVIYEIFNVVFRPYRALKQLVATLTSVGLVGLLVIALTVSTYGPAASYADWVIGKLVLLERAVSIVQCGLLIVLFGLSWYFRVSWRSYLYGIAVGFGVYSAIHILIDSVRAEAAQTELINFVIMGSYHVCVLIWTLYLLVPERAATKVTAVPAVDLEGWNQELERLLQR